MYLDIHAPRLIFGQQLTFKVNNNPENQHNYLITSFWFRVCKVNTTCNIQGEDSYTKKKYIAQCKCASPLIKFAGNDDTK